MKNFFGSLRNRARSNPDNDAGFKTSRQRSRTNPFEDKNKLKVILDSWGPGSKNEVINDLLMPENVPPVPRLPEALKQPRIRLKPLAPIHVERCPSRKGTELVMAVDGQPQTPHQRGASAPVHAETLKPRACLTPLESSSSARRSGLADATNSPRSPRYTAIAPAAELPARRIAPEISLLTSKHESSCPTGQFCAGMVLDGSATRGELLAPPQRGSSLDRVRSNSCSDSFSLRTLSTSFPSVEPLLRAPSGRSMLGVPHPQLEPLPPISPFGVCFPGSAETMTCDSGGVPPAWTRNSVDSVQFHNEPSAGKRTESDVSGGPDLHRSEDGDLVSDLSMWWGSEGAYYYDTRNA